MSAPPHRAGIGDDATYYVRRRRETGTTPLPELARVVVSVDLTTLEGDKVPAGTEGTIVAVWGDGTSYDVEFAEALGPATVQASFVRAVQAG